MICGGRRPEISLLTAAKSELPVTTPERPPGCKRSLYSTLILAVGKLVTSPIVTSAVTRLTGGNPGVGPSVHRDAGRLDGRAPFRDLPLDKRLQIFGRATVDAGHGCTELVQAILDGLAIHRFAQRVIELRHDRGRCA